MYQLYLKIPGVPKATNALLGKSFWAKHKNATVWKTLVRSQIRFKDLPEKPLEQAYIQIRRHSYRSLDYDGLVASTKPLVDALVEHGVLHNDTYKITGPWNVDQAYIKKGQEHMEMWISSERPREGLRWETITTFPV